MNRKSSAKLLTSFLSTFVLVATAVSGGLRIPRTNANATMVTAKTDSKIIVDGREEITRDVSNHQVYLPYWRSGAGFNTRIHIRNVNVRRSMVAALTLNTKVDSIKLNQVEIGPAQTLSIDVIDALRANSMLSSEEGSAVIDFEAESDGAINAFAQITNPNQSIALSFPFQRVKPKKEKTLDAVAWFHDRQTDVFISIQNTSKKSILATPTIFVDRRPLRLAHVKLGALEAATIRLPRIESGKYPFSAGVSIGYDGKPGSLIGQGWATNVARGFSTGFAFTTKEDCNCARGAENHLYGTGIPIGVSTMMGGAVFDPVLILRNVSEKTFTVTPSFSYMVGDVPGKVELPSIVLAPEETSLRQLRQYQIDGIIPETVTAGGIDLHYESKSGGLIAEMASVDQTGFFTSPVPLVCGGKRALHMSYWRTDGDWDSLLQIENISGQENSIEIIISFSGGSYVIDKRLRGGELSMISVKQLQQTQTPDKNGNVLPLFATGGGVNIWNNDADQALVLNGSVVNPLTGTCGFCGGFGVVQNMGLTDLPQNCFGTPFNEYGVNEVVSLYMYLYFDTAQCGSDSVQNIEISTPSLLQELTSTTVVTVGAGFGELEAETQNTFSGPDDPTCQSPSHLSAEGGFQIVPPPQINNISPSRGPRGATNQVTISGSGFQAGATINAGSNVTITNVAVNSASSITANLVFSASATGGARAVTVTVNGRTSNSDKTFFVQIPTRLVPFNHALAPDGIGALQTPVNANVTTLEGQVVFQNFCGVYRSYLFILADQDSPPQKIQAAFTFDEIFSNVNSPPSLAAPAYTPVNFPANYVAIEDLQSVGFIGGACLNSNEFQTFTQKFKITVGGIEFFPTTTINIKRGKEGGVHKVDRTITTQ